MASRKQVTAQPMILLWNSLIKWMKCTLSSKMWRTIFTVLVSCTQHWCTTCVNYLRFFQLINTRWIKWGSQYRRLVIIAPVTTKPSLCWTKKLALITATYPFIVSLIMMLWMKYVVLCDATPRPHSFAPSHVYTVRVSSFNNHLLQQPDYHTSLDRL